MIDPHEVPDEVVYAFAGLPIGHPLDNDNRPALAAALTAWQELHPVETGEHDCRWNRIGYKQNKVFGMATTVIAQECRICGRIKSEQLNGEWTLSSDGKLV